MADQETFTAALSRGERTGTGEMIVMPLWGDKPPETLRRPIELDGQPKFEVFELVGNQDWEDHRIANYQLGSIIDRDLDTPSTTH